MIRLLESRLLGTQGDDGEMLLLRAREDPLFLDAPSVLYRAFNGLTGADLSVPRQKEHNDMCLAIEKMKEKDRREERRKLKALEEEELELATISIYGRAIRLIGLIGADGMLILLT